VAALSTQFQEVESVVLVFIAYATTQSETEVYSER